MLSSKSQTKLSAMCCFLAKVRNLPCLTVLCPNKMLSTAKFPTQPLPLQQLKTTWTISSMFPLLQRH